MFTNYFTNLFYIAVLQEESPLPMAEDVITDMSTFLNMAKIKQSHSKQSISGKEENSMLPLHLACWKQNGDIVTYVFGKYNNATTLQDIDNNLQIHWACLWHDHLPITIMHRLLDIFRCSLLCKTRNDTSLPLHYFLQSSSSSNNELFFLTWMIYQYPESLVTSNNDKESSLTIACKLCKDANIIQLLLIYGPQAVNYMAIREIFLFMITY